MTRGRVLNARPNKRASIVALRRKSIMQRTEETEYPVFRAVRPGLDCPDKPLSKHGVFAPESCDDQVFFGTEVLVESHASDAGLLEDGIDAYRVKTNLTEHLLCDSEKMIALSDGHTQVYSSVYPKCPVIFYYAPFVKV